MPFGSGRILRRSAQFFISGACRRLLPPRFFNGLLPASFGTDGPAFCRKMAKSAGLGRKSPKIFTKPEPVFHFLVPVFYFQEPVSDFLVPVFHFPEPIFAFPAPVFILCHQSSALWFRVCADFRSRRLLTSDFLLPGRRRGKPARGRSPLRRWQKNSCPSGAGGCSSAGPNYERRFAT